MRKTVQRVLSGTIIFMIAGIVEGVPTPAPSVNGVARFMAGMDPQEQGFESFLSTPAWIDHQVFFEKNWASLATKRLNPADVWRETNVKPDTSLTTLFYPFSGPDFLNAYLFFPDCDTYVFYSLEAPGSSPSVNDLSLSEGGALLSDIQDAMGDIFLRQYFITKRMLKELRTPVLRGNAPLILVFMARMKLEVIAVQNVRLGSDGEVQVSSFTAVGALSKRAPKNPVPGVRITFRKPEGRTQTLFYFSIDVSNKGMGFHPEFLNYLKNCGEGITFLKSASYLLHGSNFSKIRESILNSTRYLLQDDSGLPYRYFGKEGWEVLLYGSYTNAIKDFNGTIQKDLDDAYKVNQPHPLPFKFGYHWYDKHSNIQIGIRKK